MRKVKFTVACEATYPAEIIVEDDNLDDEEILEMIWEKIPDLPVTRLEWLSDFEDPEKSVSMSDILSIEEVEE